MLCSECKKKEAVYHSIVIVNGAKKEQHLCAECQAKSSAAKMQPFAAGLSALPGLFPNFASMFAKPRREIKTCSLCGTTSADFLETGFVGCDRCYAEFSDILLPVIQKVQSGVNHRGKSPVAKVGGAALSPEDEYERLKRDLAAAVEIENYEEASVIRDKIRILRERL